MNPKNVALWVLAAAYLGALGEVPGLFLSRVLGTSILFATIAFVVCGVVSWRRKAKAAA